MRRRRIGYTILVGIGLLLASGCQSGNTRTTRVAGFPPAHLTQESYPMALGEQIVLVAAIDDRAATPPATTTPAASGPTSRPATAANGKPSYTAPGAAFQKMGVLLAVAAPGATSGTAGTGKEAAESRISASTAAALGAPALGAPQPRTLGAVVGQPGLQRGFASGLGFARQQTIFTPRANPLSGSTGRCNELVRTGFFPNGAACHAFFKR